MAWWDGDAVQGSTVFDIRGTNNGVGTSGSQLIAGHVGTAFSFNGSGVITVPNSPTLAPQAGMTIEGWIRPAGIQTTYARVVGLQTDGSYGSTWVFGLAFNNGVYFGLFKNGAQAYVAGNTPVASNVWTHVAGTWDGVAMRVYVNGVIQQDVAAVTPSLTSTTVPLNIGRGTSGSYGFTGGVDELTLYDRALTPAEVAAIASNPLGKCK